MSARKAVSVVAVAGAALPAGAAGAQDALYENSDPAVSAIWAELDYRSSDPGGGFRDYDTEVADDFIIPEGDGWSIERLFLPGQLWQADTFTGTLSFSIRTDNNGAPGVPVANALCAGDAVTPDITPPASLSYTLPEVCFLRPGHYWLVVSADTADDGFFYIDVSARSGDAPATDAALRFRSNCSQWFSQDGSLLPSFVELPESFRSYLTHPSRNSCSPFDVEPSNYPGLALKFGLFGYEGDPPLKEDAGVDGGTEPDAGEPDAGAELDAGAEFDAGGEPDAGGSKPDGGVAMDASTSGDGSVSRPPPGDGDGDGDAPTGDGDAPSGDGDDAPTGDGDAPIGNDDDASFGDGGTNAGKLSGGGCYAGGTSQPAQGLGTLSLAALALWLTRRRRPVR